MPDLFIRADAILSECEIYRYRLSRRWGDGPACLFIMLNPSTADALQDDPTIRRCIGFAMREGCGALEVVNLMAFRTADPADLPDDPEIASGPDNLDHIRAALQAADGPVIAAWGAHPKAEAGRELVCRILAQMNRSAYHLKRTKSGAPGHPLYISKYAPLIPMALQ